MLYSKFRDPGEEPKLHLFGQLKRIVKWLAGANDTGSVDGGAWLVPQFLANPSTWRGVVWNAGPDAVTKFRVHRPVGMPPIRNAWHLTPAGERLAVAVTAEGDTLDLSRPMHQWELVVLM